VTCQTTLLKRASSFLLLLGFILFPVYAYSQEVGESVSLRESKLGKGIPAHAKPLTKKTTFYFPNASIVTIKDSHPKKPHWLLVESSNGKSGWIINKYIKGISVEKNKSTNKKSKYSKRKRFKSNFKLDELGYKIAIVISIFGSFWLFGIRFTLLISTLWTGWTVLRLGLNSSTSLIQLAFVFGSYALANVIFKKDLQIRELKNIISIATKNNNEATKKQVEKVFLSNPEQIEKIRGKDHLKVLETAIADSKSTLCILSGWISNSVVDSQILFLLSEAMRRGVEIYIGYGYEFKGQHQRNENTNLALKTLEQIKVDANDKGKLYIKEFPNHEKIIVVDNCYMICGSNNWLSNKHFLNSEYSIKIADQILAVSEGCRIKDLIINNDCA
jgi:hypothetical protein